MAISADQHLKNTEVPEWVVSRFRKYVDSTGGKSIIMLAITTPQAKCLYHESKLQEIRWHLR